MPGLKFGHPYNAYNRICYFFLDDTVYKGQPFVLTWIFFYYICYNL